MDVGRLGRDTLIAAGGGLLLAVSLFLTWYQTGNPNAQIGGTTGALTGWEVHPTLRWLLLAAAGAPLILAWIVIRDHELSWARGEMTAVVGIAAFGLVFYSGIVTRPGQPRGEISLQVGYWSAIAGTVLMTAGAALLSAQAEKARKPPGVL